LTLTALADCYPAIKSGKTHARKLKPFLNMKQKETTFWKTGVFSLIYLVWIIKR